MRTRPLYPHLRNPFASVRRNATYGADPAAVWKNYTTSIYETSDLVALATRETLQNAEDAIKAASRRGQITRGDGIFSVTYEITDEINQTGWISWEDNGIGMDWETVKDKFLVIGMSGKRSSEDYDAELSYSCKRYTRPPGDKRGTYVFRLNGLWQFTAGAQSGKLDKDYVFDYTVSGNAGGFGVAKAVILGVSPTMDWEMETQDIYVKGARMGGDMQPEPRSMRQGTKLTVHGVNLSTRTTRDTDWEPLGIHERLTRMLAYNYLPHIKLYLNGERIDPYFGGKRGTVVPMRGDWGTSAVPATEGYPFKASRDGLTPEVRWTFERFAAEVEKDETPLRSVEDEVYDPGDPYAEQTATQRQQQKELESTMEKALESSDIQEILNKGGKAIQALAQSKIAGWKSEAQRKAESESPGLSPKEHKKTIIPRMMDTGASDLTEIEDEPVEQVAGSLKEVLEEQDRVAGARSGTEIVTEEVLETLDKIQETGEINEYDVETLGRVLTRVGEQAIEAGGGGVAQIASVQTAVTDILEKAQPDSAYAEEAIKEAKKSKRFNPFGTMAGLFISKKGFLNNKGKFDSGRAYRFKKGYAKWLPYLLLWDTVLRLIANRAGVQVAFKPGFILNDSLLGMYTMLESGTRVIYINPFKLKDAARSFKDDPLALATFIMNIAVHELAHMQTGTKHDDDEWSSHGSKWAIEREDMGNYAGPFLAAFALLAVEYLDVTAPIPAGVKAAEKVMKDKIRKLNADHKKEIGKLKRLSEKLEAQQQAACPRCYDELIDTLESGGHLDTLAWLKTKGG